MKFNLFGSWEVRQTDLQSCTLFHQREWVYYSLAGCARGLTWCCSTDGHFRGFQCKDVCSFNFRPAKSGGMPRSYTTGSPEAKARRIVHAVFVDPVCPYPRWATLPSHATRKGRIGSNRGPFSSSFQNANC